MKENNACSGSDAMEIIADIESGGLMHLESGERLWKLYCFRTPGHPTQLRHRIYTKLKANGRLGLVTFAVHDPPNGVPRPNGDWGHKSVRSNIVRVPDLSSQDLDRIVAAIHAETPAASVAREELDLSSLLTPEDQITWLRANR